MKAKPVVICVLGYLCSVSVFSNEPPSVDELLDAYAGVQDRLGNCIITGRCITTITAPESGVKARTREKQTRFELRLGGARKNLRTWEWGQVGPVYTDEKTPFYVSKYWTGSQYIRYAFWDKREVLPLGDVTVDDNPEMAAFDEGYVEPCELRGYFWGIDGRIDVFLKRAKGSIAEVRTEKVGGVLCYRLRAETEAGEVIVWFDPEHGYQIAQLFVRMKAGDRFRQKRILKKEDSIVLSLRHVEFATFNELWLPVKGEFAARVKNFQREGCSSTDKKVYAIDGYHINPDHETLNSFVIDDIRSGAVVIYYLGRTKADGGLENFIWKDNRIVDKNGAVLADFL